MATTTLTLYKHTKLDDMKNFIVDDIENYLSTKTSETITDFQYQRFELNKTIKLNKSQSYLLKGQALNKYDYLKISTGEVNYYYFILRASWKAEETIELDIKMDTLNTFGFSNTASDSTYTLSNKTLVKREHKDRLERLPVQYVSRDLTSEESFALSELDSQNYYQNTSDEDVHLLINTDGLKEFVNDGVLDIQFVLDYGSYIYYQGNKYEDIKKLRVQVISLSKRIQFLGDGLTPILTINISNLVSNLILVIPPSGNTTQSIDSGDWTQLVNLMYYTNITIDFKENVCARLIDQYQEGLSTILFKNNEKQLLDKDGVNQWYVVFASVNSVVAQSDDTEAKYVNPVAIRFYSDFGYDIQVTSDKLVTFYASDLVNYDNYAEYILLNRDTLGNGYFEYNGVQYRASDLPASAVGFSIRRDSKYLFSYLGYYAWNDFFMRYEFNSAVDSTPVSLIRFYGINEIPIYKASGSISTTSYNPSTRINVQSGGGSITGTSTKWEDLDLTDPLLIKAFAFPYVPCEFLSGMTEFDAIPNNVTYSSSAKAFELIKPQKEDFNRNIEFDQKSPFNDCFIEEVNASSQQSRNILFESKLLHSDYHQVKFVYDSFAFSFNLEDVDVTKINMDENFIAQYIVSKNVVSKFAFIFNQYVCKREVQNYNNVLTIERNNEKALFNNAYINYIRSGGFSYDTKKASSQNAMNGLTTALSIAGSFASFMGGFVTQNPVLVASGVSLAVGSVASISNNIHVAQEQDRAISQKMNQNYIQGTSVQGSEDIDILTSFSGNKAKLCYYELSDVMKQAMWDLFHYCGYATHEQKIPNVSTRLYFNFVQADIVYDEFTFNEDIADDIRNKWKEGVTFFHKVNDEWDIEQQYENFEVSLI